MFPRDANVHFHCILTIQCEIQLGEMNDANILTLTSSFVFKATSLGVKADVFFLHLRLFLHVCFGWLNERRKVRRRVAEPHIKLRFKVSFSIARNTVVLNMKAQKRVRAV
jgi:hypothetical protein